MYLRLRFAVDRNFQGSETTRQCGKPSRMDCVSVLRNLELSAC